MAIYSEIGGYLISTGTASAQVGSADMRRGAGMLVWSQVTAASALVTIQASPDGVNWGNLAIMTAVAAGVSANFSGVFPYVRAQINAIWSGSNNTGYPTVQARGGYF